jgi:hypothetical protein
MLKTSTDLSKDFDNAAKGIIKSTLGVAALSPFAGILSLVL